MPRMVLAAWSRCLTSRYDEGSSNMYLEKDPWCWCCQTLKLCFWETVSHNAFWVILHVVHDVCDQKFTFAPSTLKIPHKKTLSCTSIVHHFLFWKTSLLFLKQNKLRGNKLRKTSGCNAQQYSMQINSMQIHVQKLQTFKLSNTEKENYVKNSTSRCLDCTIHANHKISIFSRGSALCKSKI